MDLGRTLLGLTGGHPIFPEHSAEVGVFVEPTPGDQSEYTQPGEPGERKRLGRLAGIEHGMDHHSGHDAGVVTAEARVSGTRGTTMTQSDLLIANGLPDEFDFAPIAVGQIRGGTRRF
jgi:hypothetical protein